MNQEGGKASIEMVPDSSGWLIIRNGRKLGGIYFNTEAKKHFFVQKYAMSGRYSLYAMSAEELKEVVQFMESVGQINSCLICGLSDIRVFMHPNIEGYWFAQCPRGHSGPARSTLDQAIVAWNEHA